jgi:3D (Asp-Asp-Asp) domain-containing protein
MAAPAAGIAAKAATRAAGAQLVQRARRPGPPPPPKHGRRILKTLLAAAVAIILTPALIVAVLFGGAQPDAECAPDGGLPGGWTGPGSLGGVAGTGVTRAELTTARRIPGVGGTRLTPGTYSPTAYFPNPHAPATNCASTCTTTASGIRVNNATRRAYLIATNPRLNQYGALAYIWPNPYGWTGPFVVADTGSAFQGTGRLDFYIFLSPGERWQQALARAYQWGPANRVTVSAAPIRPGGPTITAPLGPMRDPVRDATPAALTSTAGACGSPVAPGALGALTGTPEQIVNRVVLYAHEHGFPSLTPASVRAANDAHSPLTAAGYPSDHKGPPDHAWAADISNGHSPTPEMDELAAAIATAFEIPWEGSGLVNHSADGYRLQLIYRAAGHYDHVHLGVKRLAA